MGTPARPSPTRNVPGPENRSPTCTALGAGDALEVEVGAATVELGGVELLAQPVRAVATNSAARTGTRMGVNLPPDLSSASPTN